MSQKEIEDNTYIKFCGENKYHDGEPESRKCLLELAMKSSGDKLNLLSFLPLFSRSVNIFFCKF